MLFRILYLFIYYCICCPVIKRLDCEVVTVELITF